MAGRGKRKSKAGVQNAESSNGEAKRPREGLKDPKSSKSGCEVPMEKRTEVEQLYKMRMPEDFYQFWDFCKHRSPDSPQDALRDTLGLQLVGPFDILAERHRGSSNAQPNFYLHYRHFYDPPELQTIVEGSAENQYHMGYFRDSPELLPAFIGENEAKKGCIITQMGDNLFAAILLFLVRKRKDRGGQKNEADLQRLEEELRREAELLGLPLEQKTKTMKLRDKRVVTKTFNGAGIVVPVDKNGVGYRELPETDAGLKRICKAIAEARDDEDRMKAFAPIQEMITFVQFANDECDYGMGYELGIDLFCYGSHYFYKVIRQLLPMAYNLLKRGLFAEILEAHLANRTHDGLDQLTPA